MPTATMFGEELSDPKTPRGRDGLWQALVRTTDEHRPLPTVAFYPQAPPTSMFAYDPAEAVTLERT